MTEGFDPAVSADIARVVASSLAEGVGPDDALELAPEADATPIDVVPAATRAFALTLTGSVTAALVLFVTDAFAEPRQDDLLALADDALSTGANQLLTATGIDASIIPTHEIGVFDALTADAAATRVYPLLRAGAPLACLAIHRGAPDDAHEGDEPAPIDGAGDLAVHEFAALQSNGNGNGQGNGHGNGNGHGPTRSLSILQDVEMGVTAELGRRRMTVRELLALTPGTVIELDRAAGSPVDLLVNGHLIARGEVVVIDEEFGIRISEIVRSDLTNGQ